MSTPLADRLRPTTLDDIVGQKHLLEKGKPLRNIIESTTLPNLIFYGPPGVGKTTLARMIAQTTNRTLKKLNGTSASTADIKDIIAQIGTFTAPNGVLLYLDEIQYFNKRQQQSLLEYVENGDITLIASTTENPYFYIYGALLSRSTVFEFKSISAEEIVPAIQRAFTFLEEEQQSTIQVDDGILAHIAHASGGDVRKAINLVELAVLATPKNEDGIYVITTETVDALSEKGALRYDKANDEHYDIVSAYQKSMRGSDPDAAIHYLARLLEAGDLPSACRRLLVTASEDVGLAYPMIMPIVQAAVDTALQVGLPEARIPLANAVILVATSPKSNSAYNAINSAMADIQAGKSGPIPRTLQNKHFDGEDNQNKGQFYAYPHDFQGHWAPQQYLPDSLKNATYYVFGDNKFEQGAKSYWTEVKDKNKNNKKA